MSRLDQALVERGLCDSREKAKRAVMAGGVRVNGQTAHKPSDEVSPDHELALDAREKYVSRGVKVNRVAKTMTMTMAWISR